MNPVDSSLEFDLCDELLLLILQYVGKHRQSTSLVCKRFYRLNCEIEKNSVPLRINNEWLENREIYDSIVNSSRIFNTLLLDTNKISSLISYWRLRQIVFVHGAAVRHVVWDSCKMTRTEVISILNLIPNLQSLEAISWKLESEYYDEPHADLNVQNLRELKISKSNETTEEFFLAHLPDNVLQSLSTDFDSCKILEKQADVKCLDLSVEVLPHTNLSGLPPLSRLTMMLRRYNSGGYQILHSLLPFQSNLTYLDLVKCEGIFDGDNESFVCICNMSALKTLKINVDALSERTFNENFSKLSGLIELEIESVEHDFSPLVDIIDDFSKMNFTRLQKLRIDVECLGIPVNRVERFGKNFTSLRNFTLRCNMPLSLDTYLKNLKSLESVKIDYHYNREFSKICNEYEEEQVYGTLRHIELQGFNFGSEINWNEASLIRLVKMLPNIEVLDIDINLPLNSKLFENIFQKLPKLRTIKNLYMVQSGDAYEKFDGEFIARLIETADRLRTFSIELKLKAVDMDVMLMKKRLSEEFKFGMRRFGNFIILSLVK